MKFARLYEELTQSEMASLREVDLPLEDTYDFFGLRVKFKSNSPALLKCLAQSFAYFLCESVSAEAEFQFIENGLLYSQVVFRSPSATYYIYKTSNGIMAIHQEHRTQEMKIGYLGEKPKVKLPWDQINIADHMISIWST